MIIERNSILDVLSKVVGITDRHNVMPILRNVKLSFGETSTITATDLEVSAIVSIPKADEELTLLLNGRLLLDIMKGLNPGSVEIVDSNGNSVKLEASGITINCSGRFSVTASTVEISAGMVKVDAGMSKFSGIVQADTVISNSVISASYTPGAGNIW